MVTLKSALFSERFEKIQSLGKQVNMVASFGGTNISVTEKNALIESGCTTDALSGS